MDVFLGQILTFAGNFVPQGFVACNGQQLPISQYDVLYNLIGTTYGGDGVTTFCAPDLQGRTPVHQGQGRGLSNYVIGQKLGFESITLTSGQLPAHNHPVSVASNGTTANANVPAATTLLSDTTQSGPDALYPYAPFQNTNQVALAPNTISVAPGSTPHENRQPFLAMTYGIAVVGIYPSQS
jgi:microcystin-dependent protein